MVYTISTFSLFCILYFGKFTNFALHAASSYPAVLVGAVSAVPSNVTLYSVATPSAYNVYSTLAPVGAVVLPSAFFHSLVALASVASCVFVIFPPFDTGSVVDAVYPGYVVDSAIVYTISVVVPTLYFGKFTNVAFHAALSYPPVTVGTVPSAVPSSVTV